MRTTIDLPDDLHQLARQIAHEMNKVAEGFVPYDFFANVHLACIGDR